nr:hypothetical protein [Streptomyces sp. S063]
MLGVEGGQPAYGRIGGATFGGAEPDEFGEGDAGLGGGESAAEPDSPGPRSGPGPVRASVRAPVPALVAGPGQLQRLVDAVPRRAEGGDPPFDVTGGGGVLLEREMAFVRGDRLLAPAERVQGVAAQPPGPLGAGAQDGRLVGEGQGEARPGLATAVQGLLAGPQQRVERVGARGGARGGQGSDRRDEPGAAGVGEGAGRGEVGEVVAAVPQSGQERRVRPPPGRARVGVPGRPAIARTDVSSPVRVWPMLVPPFCESDAGTGVRAPAPAPGQRPRVLRVRRTVRRSRTAAPRGPPPGRVRLWRRRRLK